MRQNRLLNFVTISISTCTLIYFTGWFDAAILPKTLLITFIFAACLPFLALNRFKVPQNKVAGLIYASLISLVCIALTSLVLSDDLYVSIYGSSQRYLGFLNLIFCFLYFFLGTLTSGKEDGMATFTRVIAYLGLLQSTLAIAQDEGFKLYKYAIANPVVGTFANSNYLSSFLGFAVVCSFAHVLEAPSFRAKTPYGVIYLLGAYALVITGSIQGFVIALVGTLLLTYPRLRSHRIFQRLFVIVVGASLLFVLSGIVGRGPLRGLLFQDSTLYRTDYWRAGLQIMRKHALYGLGPDHYVYGYPLFRDKIAIARRANVMADNAHNFFIQLGACYGLIFFIIFLIIVLTLLFLALKQALDINFATKFTFSRIFAIFWIGYFLLALVSIENMPINILGMFSGGVVLANATQRELIREKQSSLKKPRRPPNSVTTYRYVIVSSVFSLFLVLLSIPQIRVMSQTSSWLQGKSAIPQNIHEDPQALLFSKKLDIPVDRAYWFRTVEILFLQQRLRESKSLLQMMESYWPTDTKILGYEAQIELLENNQESAYLLRSRAFEINPRDVENLLGLIKLSKDLRKDTEFKRFVYEYKVLTGHTFDSMVLSG